MIGRSVMKSVLVASVCFCVTWCQAADEVSPSVRPLSDEDFAAGIVLTKIGTGESFDFSAPEGSEVCADWEAFGAARDWFRLGFGVEDDFDEYESEEGWSFAMGTNRVDSFTVFSYGTVRPSVTNVNTCISPLNAVIGIVPVSNHGMLDAADRPSRFWHYLTPSNTLQLTWQNVLLDREVSKAVSFQAEIDIHGDVTFKYDLSRLPEEALANLSVGVMNDGRGRMFSCLPRDITSLRWRYLDPSLPNFSDHDGDGISTSDELFIYGTDPYSVDTDRDGLTDGEEIAVTKTNPTDRYSSDPRFTDSVASALGGADPYSCPNGDGRTAFENVVYTGSSDGRGGEPASDSNTAVLEVSAVGSGRGVLMVGDKAVPLLQGVNPIKVAVPKGLRMKLKCELEGELYLNYNSSDFCIGKLPYGARERGWVLFPKFEATHPCIHTDTCVVEVRLDPGIDDDDFTCAWRSDTEDVGVENFPPLSARLAFSFSRKSTASVRYEVRHPKYLFGETSFRQVCEYCPKIEDDEDYDSTKDYLDSEPSYYSDVEQEWCDEHKCPKSWCWDRHNGGGFSSGSVSDEESLHDAYFTATNSPSQFEYVLKLHRPEGVSERYDSQKIHVVVPTDKVRCCSCEEHWAGYASIGHKNHRVNVHCNGESFFRTTKNCDLTVYGVAPSSDFGDSRVSIITNGATWVNLDYTVFGVSILGHGVDLRKLNELNSDFGLPVVVNTNLDDAAEIVLCTDVNLPDGIVHLSFENATTRMQLWMTYWSEFDGCMNRICILDSETCPSREFLITEWRRLVAMVTSKRKTTLQLLAYGRGSAKLFFGYAGGKDGKYLHDEAVQTITAIRPPLLPDYNRDGRIDDADAQLARDRRFCFWTNKDIWRGDDAFAIFDSDHLTTLFEKNNGTDDCVNGRNDLVNQLPVAVFIEDLFYAWRDTGVKFIILPYLRDEVRRCYGDAKWDNAKASVLSDIEADDESSFWELFAGNKMYEMKLREFADGGDVLTDSKAERCIEQKGMMYIEAETECTDPVRIVAVLDDKILFSYTPRMRFSDVEKMYRWHNIRGAADNETALPDSDGSASVLPSPAGWPDSERDDSNMYFVHGYNVSAEEARSWGQAFFKRMWWAGMNAKFHVVTWFGNETQIDLPIVGLVSPNYHVNVENAFASSKAFVELVKKYHGKNYVAAHSLGNMLVSSAIQDWDLPYEKYFMINAAVATEAYDISAVTAETTRGMTPHNWDGVPAKYRSTHWFEHKDFDEKDARRRLTWRNRFNKIDKAVNYYSSEEEVLKCDPSGDGKWKLQRDWSWYNQERIKGDNPVPGSRDEGGWAYNAKYRKRSVDSEGVETYDDPTVADVLAIKDDLRCSPVFRPFEDSSLMTIGLVHYIPREMISQLLADAIPAESFPAGFNEVQKWNEGDYDCDNFDMGKMFKDNASIYFWSSDRRWGHSFFLGAPYMVVHGLFENMKGKMK